AGAIHLVDESQTRHMVLVGLAPDGFRLGLHATHGAIHHACAIQDAHGTLDFDGEVNVSGGVDDVDPVLGTASVHALPETGDGGRGDGDAPLLFLLHPVRGGGAIVHLAQLVAHTCIKQYALGGRGFTCIDMRRNTDIAIALNWSLASHVKS